MKKLILLILSLFLISCSNQNIQTNQDQTNTGTNKIANIVLESIKNSTGEVNNSGEINNFGLTIKTGKYCLLDMCIPENAEITQSGGNYIAQTNSGSEDSFQNYSYTLSLSGTYLEVTFEEMMHTQVTKIIKIGDKFVKQIDNSGCGGSNLDQKVYDESGNEVNYLFPELENEDGVKIGNITYYPTLVGTGGFGQPLDSYNAFKIFREDDGKGDYKIYEDEKQFQTFLENQALNVEKKLYKSYIAKYSKYSDVYVIYNSDSYDGGAFRVIWLGTDENYLSKNINGKGELLDLIVTNKILSYYGEGASEGFTSSSGGRLYEIDESQMPFFNVEKLNDKGNYLVYGSLEQFAEMCKPVVYYYSKQKTQNSLNIGLGAGDYFTKTIPNFTSKNTWDFESENGKIKLDNKNYDYLYYSLVKVGYESNKDGWIVLGKDIVSFFEDKLEKINFNTKEKKDFIDYWKNEFEANKYYFVSFKYTDEMNKLVKLNFKNQPENEFRVLLDSYVLGNTLPKDKEKYLYKTGEKDLKDKYLIKRFERNKVGDEVFEWGGVLKKEDKTVVY